MQFLEHGPDIPNEFVNALLNDNAVLFCGAGISMNEGLPDFRELTEHAIDSLLPRDQVVTEHLCHARFDAVFQRICEEVHEQSMRDFLSKWLSFDEQSTMAAHKTLLSLARSRSNRRIRLVTTNFDEGFEAAAEILFPDEPIAFDVAPRLPPVRQDWWSIVHLHGKLKNESMRDLVLTSGQFGEAYMTEGWAARFVAELFRLYTVVFVGYSVDDPVIRYVVDAYRSVHLKRDDTPNPYAFVGSSAGEKAATTDRWRAKNVIPVWYQICERDHTVLYRTFSHLSDLKERGAEAPRLILSQYCKGSADELSSTVRSQVIWALNELEQRRVRWTARGPAPNGAVAALAQVSPIAFESWMRLLMDMGLESASSIVARYPRLESEIWATGLYYEHQAAGNWIARQLASNSLIAWITERGGFLSPIVAHAVYRSITDDLSGEYRAVWCAICSLSTRSPYWSPHSTEISYGIYGPGSPEQRANALVELCMPALRLAPAYIGDNLPDEEKDPLDLVQLDVVLPVDEHPHSAVKHLREAPEWQNVLRMAASGLFQRLDELGALLRRLKSTVGFIPFDIVYYTSLDYDFSSFSTGNNWRIVPALVIECAGILWNDTRHRDTIKEWMRHRLAFPHSVVHDRVALRFVRDHFFLPSGLFVKILKNRVNELLNDTCCRELMRVIFDRHSKKFSSRQKHEITTTIVQWLSIHTKTEKPKKPERYETLAAMLLRPFFPTDEALFEIYPWATKAFVNQSRQTVNLRDVDAEFEGRQSSKSDFSEVPISETIDRLNVNERAGSAFIAWTEKNGIDQALLVVNDSRSNQGTVEAALHGIERWLDKNRNRSNEEKRSASADSVLSVIEVLDDKRFLGLCEFVPSILRAISFPGMQNLRTRLLEQFDRCFDMKCHVTASVDYPEEPFTDAMNSGAFKLTEMLLNLLPPVVETNESVIPADIVDRLAVLLNGHGRPRSRTVLALTRHLAYLCALDAEWTAERLEPVFSDDEQEVMRYAWCGFLTNPTLTPTVARILAPAIPTGIHVAKDVQIVREHLGTLPVALYYHYSNQFSTKSLRAVLAEMDDELLAEAIRGMITFLPSRGSLPDAWESWIRDVLEAMPAAVSKYSAATTNAFVILLGEMRPIAHDAFRLVSPHLVQSDTFDYCIRRLTRVSESQDVAFVTEYPAIAFDLVKQIVVDQPQPWQKQTLKDFLVQLTEIDDAYANDDGFRKLRDWTIH